MNLRYFFVFALFLVFFVSFGYSSECTASNRQACEELVIEMSKKAGVDPDQTLVIAEIESNFNPNAQSGVGAQGLMQLYGDKTAYFNEAKKRGLISQDAVYDKFDPEVNVAMGVLEWEYCLEVTESRGLTIMDAAAMYNGGIRALNPSNSCPGEMWYECEENKGYAETRGYVDKFSSRYIETGSDFDRQVSTTDCYDTMADTGGTLACIGQMGDTYDDMIEKDAQKLLKYQKTLQKVDGGDFTTGVYLDAVGKIAELNDEISKLEASGSTSDELKELKKQRNGLMEFVSNIDDTVELIFAAANDEQREDIATALSGSCNPSIWNAWCVFKKKIDLRDEVTSRVQTAVTEATKKCNADKTCSAEEYNQLLNAELEKLRTMQCFVEDLECQELKELLEEQIELNSAVDTNYGFDIISAIVRPDKASIDAAKFFGFEADYSNIPSFLRESVPSYLCMSKIEGYVDKEIRTDGGVTKYGCDSQFEQEFDYSVSPPSLKSDGSPNCIAVLGDIRAQKTQLTPDGKVDITYSAYIKAPGFKVNYLVAVTYLQGGDKKKVALTDLKELSNKSNDKIYDHATIPINQTEGELDEGSFVIGLLAVDESNNPYLTLTAPVVTISAGDSYYDNTAGYSNSGGNDAASSNTNQISTNDMLDLI